MSYNHNDPYQDQGEIPRDGYDQQQYDEYGQPIYGQDQYYPEDQGYYDQSGEYYQQNAQGDISGAPDSGAYHDQGYYDQPRGMGQDPENFSDFSYAPPGTPGTPGGYDSYGGGSGNGYAQYTPSQMSYGDPRSSGASTPIYGGEGFDPSAVAMALPTEPYPAWTADTQTPVTADRKSVV